MAANNRCESINNGIPNLIHGQGSYSREGFNQMMAAAAALSAASNGGQAVPLHLFGLHNLGTTSSNQNISLNGLNNYLGFTDPKRLRAKSVPSYAGKMNPFVGYTRAQNSQNEAQSKFDIKYFIDPKKPTLNKSSLAEGIKGTSRRPYRNRTDAVDLKQPNVLYFFKTLPRRLIREAYDVLNTCLSSRMCHLKQETLNIIHQEDLDGSTFLQWKHEEMRRMGISNSQCKRIAELQRRLLRSAQLSAFFIKAPQASTVHLEPNNQRMRHCGRRRDGTGSMRSVGSPTVFLKQPNTAQKAESKVSGVQDSKTSPKRKLEDQMSSIPSKRSQSERMFQARLRASSAPPSHLQINTNSSNLHNFLTSPAKIQSNGFLATDSASAFSTAGANTTKVFNAHPKKSKNISTTDCASLQMGTDQYLLSSPAAVLGRRHSKMEKQQGPRIIDKNVPGYQIHLQPSCSTISNILERKGSYGNELSRGSLNGVSQPVSKISKVQLQEQGQQILDSKSIPSTCNDEHALPRQKLEKKTEDVLFDYSGGLEPHSEHQQQRVWVPFLISPRSPPPLRQDQGENSFRNIISPTKKEESENYLLSPNLKIKGEKMNMMSAAGNHKPSYFLFPTTAISSSNYDSSSDNSMPALESSGGQVTKNNGGSPLRTMPPDLLTGLTPKSKARKNQERMKASLLSPRSPRNFKGDRKGGKNEANKINAEETDDEFWSRLKLEEADDMGAGKDDDDGANDSENIITPQMKIQLIAQSPRNMAMAAKAMRYYRRHKIEPSMTLDYDRLMLDV
eukprot:jgi/Bigna1/91786/estExt_fgenesh1_pg.C_1190017